MPDEKPGRCAARRAAVIALVPAQEGGRGDARTPAEVQPKGEAAPVELPPVESLTPDSDFSLFMRPQVQPALRQAALKKLFTDPHFNLMDGLDIYIDDYTRPDPIAASIVAELTQFRNLDGLPRETTPADMADPETSPEVGSCDCSKVAARGAWERLARRLRNVGRRGQCCFGGL